MKIPENKKELDSLLEKFPTNYELGKVLGKSESAVRRLKKRINDPIETKNTELKPKEMTDGEKLNKFVDYMKQELSNISPLAELKTSKVVGETLVIELCDWHIGSVDKDGESGEITYDINIARERAEKLCQKILYLITEHITHGTKISDITILMAGDMVDGELVYDEQAFSIEVAPPKQVLVCVEIIVSFLRSLLKTGIPVSIYAVKGNHGIPKVKGLNPESNWDLMVYIMLDFWARETRPKNLSIKYADGDFINVDVRGWKYHLRHKAPAQSETAAGGIRIAGWTTIHECDAVVSAHLHHFAMGEWNGIRTFMGGSLKGLDSFSEGLARGTNPSQLVWGVTSKHLSSFVYIVDLI